MEGYQKGLTELLAVSLAQPTDTRAPRTRNARVWIGWESVSVPQEVLQGREEDEEVGQKTGNKEKTQKSALSAHPSVCQTLNRSRIIYRVKTESISAPIVAKCCRTHSN